MNRRIRIRSSAEGTEHEVELPADIAMERLLPAIIDSLGLPRRETSEEIRYRLTIQDRFISSGQTLLEAGVADGDTLTLVPEVTAGCFPSGTRITLADGTNCVIEDIRPGHQVLSYDVGHRETSAGVVKQVLTTSA